MKISYDDELKDSRAVEWMELRHWIREYIISANITMQQFIEAFCNDERKYYWIRCRLDANDEIAARKIVRGEERYITLYKQLLNAKSDIEKGNFKVRPMTPIDILEDVDILPLGKYFPLYGVIISFDNEVSESKVDITNYKFGNGNNENIVVVVNLQIVENYSDKMNIFISELSKIYITELSKRGFGGILQIKNERGWMFA